MRTRPMIVRSGLLRRRPRTWIRLVLALAWLALPAAGIAQTETSAAHAHGHPGPAAHEHGSTVVAEPVGEDAPPPLFVGMGDHTMGRASERDEAQAYFDQGVMMAYAFNHPEAAASFVQAATLDPECALCAWGEALVLGPNINAVMEPEVNERAYRASREALARLDDGSSELERDLVIALAARYAADAPADRSALDGAYADSMRAVAARHPEHPDVQALFADALMTTMPWNYWTPDAEPRPATVEAQAALEAALEADLRHPLANHLWIHLREKHTPEVAVEAAERLEGLAPAGGHLVHMPAHIYIRVGRYADAVIANQRAIVADQAYLAQSGTEGLYRIGYVPHNVHFLWAAATLAGRSRTALEAADRLKAQVDPEMVAVPGYDFFLQDFWVTPLLARVRFGRWDEVLAWPEEDEALPYPQGIRHYARAVALARKGRLDEAREEVEAVRRLAADPRMEALMLWQTNPASTVLEVAAGVAEGEVVAAAGDFDGAVRALRGAIEAEAVIIYQEPEMWHHPVRQVLGDILLRAGRNAEARRVFEEDLRKYPENGWSLWGLATALERLDEWSQAAAAWERFRVAFRDADIELTGSIF